MTASVVVASEVMTVKQPTATRMKFIARFITPNTASSTTCCFSRELTYITRLFSTDWNDSAMRDIAATMSTGHT